MNNCLMSSPAVHADRICLNRDSPRGTEKSGGPPRWWPRTRFKIRIAGLPLRVAAAEFLKKS